jgi:sialic acid synthase SpsE
MKFLINKKEIGRGNPTYVIAEMAWSHDGSFDNAKRIVNAAAKAKADAICIHLTSMPDYMVENYKSTKSSASKGAEENLYNFLSSKNLSKKDWSELISLAHALGLSVCAMCNDTPSVNFAAGEGVDAFVLSPASTIEKSLIRKMAYHRKHILIRTGGANLGEIEKVINEFKTAGVDQISLIRGFQSFPTDIDEMNLNLIEILKKTFSLPVGFADHVDASSKLALVVPLVAVARGADLIEKHLTHDRSLKGIDYESALNPEEFAKMVKNIRDVEKSFGKSCWASLSEKEIKYRDTVRKRAVALRDITKGEKFSFDNVAFKRANDGFLPDEFEHIVGRKAKKDLSKNEPITWDCVG